MPIVSAQPIMNGTQKSIVPELDCRHTCHCLQHVQTVCKTTHMTGVYSSCYVATDRSVLDPSEHHGMDQIMPLNEKQTWQMCSRFRSTWFKQEYAILLGTRSQTVYCQPVKSSLRGSRPVICLGEAADHGSQGC